MSKTRPVARVVKVEARPGFRLFLEFADGLRGELELEDDLWGEVFEPLRDRPSSPRWPSTKGGSAMLAEWCGSGPRRRIPRDQADRPGWRRPAVRPT